MRYYIFPILLFCFLTTTHGQRSRNQTETKSPIWYGGSVDLGFQQNAFLSSFRFGLFPMVGYKLTEEWSIGPRIGMGYENLRSRTTGAVEKFNLVEFSVGAFTRYKVYNPFFAHIEYEYQNDKFPIFIGNQSEVVSEWRDNFYIGAGYSQGDRIKFEIMILYNTIADPRNFNNPFVYRAGFNVNF